MSYNLSDRFYGTNSGNSLLWNWEIQRAIDDGFVD